MQRDDVSVVSFPKAHRAQQTLSRPAEVCGKSLFHGYDAVVRLLPADEDIGIVFRRSDLSDAPDIPAAWQYLAQEPRRTVLQRDRETRVETVEHLMAALTAMEVDNCVVDVNAPELPALDGSSLGFCDAVLNAGLTRQSAEAIPLIIDRLHVIQSPDRRQSLVARPYVFRRAAITYHLDYGRRAVIPPQSLSVEVTPEYFYQHLAAARTFVLESEIAALKKLGYGRHLTAKDIVVIAGDGATSTPLRWADEGVRHKILDCLGDLALCGRPFAGHVTSCRSGHHLNHELAKSFADVADHRNAGDAFVATTGEING
ncbi:MAG: UDP-3-O-acyl-N-acetylglucosamine deacetylase [Planctomycetaceae bacterium]|nr:UDP-3-O-acyl-N-acetylglucosamine deacetylase [Planctomycetaceae bacterium]